jgi:hypothetical protein
MADRLNLWTLDPATPAWVHNMRRTNDTVQGVWGAVLEVVLRRREPFTVNHAIDSLHCVVPTAVCDFVLLDGHWTAIANQVATPPRRARAFSRRDGGIEAFLDALERITPPPEFK